MPTFKLPSSTESTINSAGRSPYKATSPTASRSKADDLTLHFGSTRSRVYKTLPHAAGRAHLSSASWPRPRRLAEISALSLPRHLSTGHKYATRAGNVSDCDCAAKYCYMYVQNAFTASTVLAVNCVQCLSSRFLCQPLLSLLLYAPKPALRRNQRSLFAAPYGKGALLD